MRRIFAAAISLAVLLSTPGLATADTYTRPPGNQKYIDAVIARGLSQRGVPFTYGGGDANGPTKGSPQQPPTASDPTASLLGVPQFGTGPQLASPQLGTPQVSTLSPTAGVVVPQAADPRADVVGFDASGLMVYAFAGAGVKLPRSSGQQYNAGMKVPPAQALPGDLIFYGPDGTQSVALFLGNGQMLETTDSGVAVSQVRTAGMTPYLTRIIA